MAEVLQPHADHVLAVDIVERSVPPGTLRTRGTGQSCDRLEAQQHRVAQEACEAQTARHLRRSARVCQIQCG
ncbi:conserved hypothetical protein [Xanthomonas citri pv. fuscans]|nr:conserved hypothetical protein [Xanthomonas citri pv. fuscans]